MGKLLVIQNADFSDVAVTKVTPTFIYLTPTITISSSGLVTIVASEGSSIYYTTDGSTPTDSSNLYTNPFTISASVSVISAIAIKGKEISDVVQKSCINALSVGTQLASALLLHEATTSYSPDMGGYLLDDTSSRANYERATVVIPVSASSSPSPLVRNSFEGVYTHVCIPKGAKKLAGTMTNSNYYYGIVLFWDNAERDFDSGWIVGSQQSFEVDLTQYSDKDIWVAFTFKKGSAGQEAFPDETLSSMGWSITVEY